MRKRLKPERLLPARQIVQIRGELIRQLDNDALGVLELLANGHGDQRCLRNEQEAVKRIVSKLSESQVDDRRKSCTEFASPLS